MIKYTLDEIVKLWVMYKTPLFKSSGNGEFIPEHFKPGTVIGDKNLEVVYEWDKNMDFPTFIKKYEIDEMEKNIKKLKE